LDNEILDYLGDKPQPTWKKRSYLFPLVIYTIGIVWSGIFGYLGQVQDLIGLVAVIITWIVLYFNRTKGILINGLIIIAGILTIAKFFPYQITVGLYFNSIFIGVDLLNISIGGLFLHFNMGEFKPQFQRLIYGSSEINTEIENSRVNHFKNRFKGKSIEELIKISENPSILKEAQDAAKELIVEKSNNSDH